MSGILSGLEKFGLGSLKSIEIYKEKETEIKQENNDVGGRVMGISEESILFDKSYTCPCCGENFKAKADKIISLSRLTLAHKIAKLLLFEQIFRALCINANHPYHK